MSASAFSVPHHLCLPADPGSLAGLGATEEDWDLGMPIGMGATPFDAVKDLLERMEDSLLLGAHFHPSPCITGHNAADPRLNPSSTLSIRYLRPSWVR